MLMEDFNDTVYSLGEYLHLSGSSISRYTSGENAPLIPVIQMIAEKYGVNPAWLAGTVGAEKYIDIEETKGRKIKILGVVAAGIPIQAQEDVIGYEYVPKDSKITFCLKVKGDSMVGARILDGDIIFVREQPQVENGEIAVVIVDNDNATLKRFYKINGTIFLRSENPNVPEQVYNKKDKIQIKIVGKAISFKSEVR